MKVTLISGSTCTVNADEFSIDDEGNLVCVSQGVSVAGFANGQWSSVWLVNQVSMP